MTKIPGLSAETANRIISIISRNKRVRKIVLFGSRATGTYSPSSDIDLVLFGKKLSLDDETEIISNLENMKIPHKIDILIHHNLSNNELREEITKNGKVIFKRWSFC